eukprot:COSAG02_NODE_155_length_33066_cov_32.167562_10_plen_271_part_00
MPRQLKDKAAFGNGRAVQKYKSNWGDYASLDLHGNHHKIFVEHPEYLELLDAIVSGTRLWEPKAAALWPQEGTKPQGATILHGDAHQWNHLFRKPQHTIAGEVPADPNDLMLIDWQFTGGGHCAWEVYYMMVLGHEFRSIECDLELLRYYHTQLTTQIAEINRETNQQQRCFEYQFDQFYEDFCVTILDTIAQDVITFTRFINVDAVEEMMADEKRRELMLLTFVCRERNFERAQAHVIQTPTMRAALMGFDVDDSVEIPSEESPLVEKV